MGGRDDVIWWRSLAVAIAVASAVALIAALWPPAGSDASTTAAPTAPPAGQGSATAPTPRDASTPGPAPSALTDSPVPGGSAPDGSAPDGEDRIEAVLVRRSGDVAETVLTDVIAAGGADHVAAIRGGPALLTTHATADGKIIEELPEGWGLPVDVMAIDPATYAPFLPSSARAMIERLEPGEALLGSTSAELREADPGDRLTVDGVALEVVGVIDDRYVRAAELVVHAADAEALETADLRFVLAGTRDGLSELMAAVTAAVGDEETVVRTLGRAPWTAQWRVVIPQSVLKRQFGEFAIRPTAGQSVEQSTAFVDTYITAERLPLLGTLTCHRRTLDALRQAVAELRRRGLGDLIEDTAGCYNPRQMTEQDSVSRHAWGAAVDINARDNPYGYPSQQDPRLVEVMARHGFVWGGDWPTPDAMHFELTGTPPD